MAEKPHVSLIATVLNEVDAIGELVSSLSRQTVRDVEIVIVDGGSTDGTWERLQQLASEDARLRVFRDQSCNLKMCPGPIARGRNRAIELASAEVIACADAGCDYEPQWAANLTAPILAGEADYALGGSCIDPAQPDTTVWDIAAAPFLGLRLRTAGSARSATGRSMAFRKSAWRKAGGFPEDTLMGEDTLFELRLRQVATSAAPAGAMARYRPRFSLRSAAARLGAYCAADGALGIRRAKFVRNLLRCVAELAALIALPWTAIPAFVMAALEIYFAFEREARSLFSRRFLKLVPARLIFSLAAPWIVTFNHLAGSLGCAHRANPQNLQEN